jgi:hypothetical protein
MSDSMCVVCEAILTSFWDEERVQKQITGGGDKKLKRPTDPIFLAMLP